MPRSGVFPQICAAVSASLIFILIGYHCQRSTMPMPNDQNVKANLEGMFTIFGTICGLPLGVILSYTSGRKTTLLLMVIPFVNSSVLIALLRIDWWALCLSRFIAGLSFGAAFIVTPMYIGEIADGRIRGSLCLLMPIMMQIGQLIRPYTAESIIGIVVPVVFATGLLWAPESPYYYAMKKAPNEMQKSLAWLRGTHDVVHEAQQIHDSVQLPVQRMAGCLVNLFKVGSNRKALMIMIGLVTCQSLCDYSAVFHYSIWTLRNDYILMNFDILLFMIGSLYLVTTIGVVFLIDKIGRRQLLLVSASYCAVFLLTAILHCLLQIIGFEGPAMLLLQVVAQTGYLISFSMGLGTLPYVIGAEIFSCDVKAFAIAICTVYYFAASYGVRTMSLFFRDCYDYYHHDLYLVDLYTSVTFTVGTVLSVIFVHFVVPETRKLSLTEIQAIFQRLSKSSSEL